MFDKFHAIVARAIVSVVALVAFAIELLIRAVCLVVALALYLFFALSAPLWSNVNVSWCGSFIEWSFSLNFRMTLKVARAYFNALGLK